jgi:hypothetical protein
LAMLMPMVGGNELSSRRDHLITGFDDRVSIVSAFAPLHDPQQRSTGQTGLNCEAQSPSYSRRCAPRFALRVFDGFSINSRPSSNVLEHFFALRAFS